MGRTSPTDASLTRPASRGGEALRCIWGWHRSVLAPLGAGGWFVRLNGRIYEAVQAIRERRRPFDLYHTALEVRVPEGRFVIENSWPIPDGDGRARGVT